MILNKLENLGHLKYDLINEVLLISFIIVVHLKFITSLVMWVLFCELRQNALKFSFKDVILKWMIISFCNLLTVQTNVEYTWMLNFMNVSFFSIELCTYIFITYTDRRRKTMHFKIYLKTKLFTYFDVLNPSSNYCTQVTAHPV